MTALALDLGTKTGWAVWRPCHVVSQRIIASGTWDLKPKRDDSSGMRFIYFRGKLRAMREAYPDIRHVVYEAVARHAGTHAAHVYGGFQSHLTTWCHENKVSHQGVPVGTLKKWATSTGNANKAAMVVSARAQTGLDIADDNEADAVLLALYAAEQEPGR